MASWISVGILGLAGIYLLMNDPEQAVKEYRKVLQLAAKFSSAEKEGKLVVGKKFMFNLFICSNVTNVCIIFR